MKNVYYIIIVTKAKSAHLLVVFHKEHKLTERIKKMETSFTIKKDLSKKHNGYIQIHKVELSKRTINIEILEFDISVENNYYKIVRTINLKNGDISYSISDFDNNRRTTRFFSSIEEEFED